MGVREENQEQDVETRARRDGEGEGRIDSGAISISSRNGILLCQVQESPKVSYQTGVPQIRPRGQAPCALHRGQDEVMAMNTPNFFASLSLSPFSSNQAPFRWWLLGIMKEKQLQLVTAGF